jgi:FKBP-type peptidyl-prolyl cis-trans isomerase SlpA
LSPEQAYGARNPALLRRVSRRDFEARSEAGATFVAGDLVEFPAPGGGRFAGVLKELNDDDALFDFNHPLAGHDIVFEVEILSVL